MPYFILIYFGGIAGTVVLAAASGSLAKAVYLAGCVLLSVWSSRKNPWDYLLLTLWIASLTPLAGRLVDMLAGWDARNIMLMAPFLVALPMVPSILQRIRALDSGAALFPGVAALCIFYGFILTLLRGEPVPALIGVADWGAPVLYYFFVVVHRDRIPELLTRLRGFVAANMLLLGSYGIWQFVNPPIWDRFWLQSTDVGAFGLPEPFLVRVFSTLNSPGPYSCWIMVLIVVSFGFTSRLMPLARLAALLSLAFTSVRTSWAGLALALLLVLAGSGRKAIGYVLGIAVGSVVVIAVVATVPQVNDVITQRIKTFQDIQQDGSLLEREEEASRMLTLIADNPFGVGVGTLGRGTIAANSGQILFVGAIDNGVLEIFGSLGWLVGLIYCAALAGMALQCFRGSPGFAQEIRVTRAAGLAALAALPFTNIASGVTGTVMWLMFSLSWSLSAAAAANTTGWQRVSSSTRRLDLSPIK
jgi:hypothetical protein